MPRMVTYVIMSVIGDSIGRGVSNAAKFRRRQ